MPPPLSFMSIDVEPVDAGQVLFLLMAPGERSGTPRGQLNVYLRLSNSLANAVHVSSIQLRVLPQDARLSFITDLAVPGGSSEQWTQSGDLVFTPARQSELEITVNTDGQPAVVRTLPMASHVSPTDGYRFWGKVHDLRPGEYWHVNGTSHGQSNYAQLFAYDVSLGVAAPNDQAGNAHLFPAGVHANNHDHRIWGKPIYAVSDGTVTDLRNDFPTNPVAGEIHPRIENFWTSVKDGGQGKDGNGNFVVVSGRNESVPYAHMQPGSLGQSVRSIGATVRKGDFIGLVGNSGSSSGPHLHIHSNVQNGGPTYWVGEPRPMTFRNAHAVRWSALEGNGDAVPWVNVNN